MTIIEISELIKQLKKENETNTHEERKFNEEWLKLIYKACSESFDKTYRFNKVKTYNITTKSK